MAESTTPQRQPQRQPRREPQRQPWLQPTEPGDPIPIPASAPENLELRHEAPEPLLPEDADLGVAVKRSSAGDAKRPHRIVTIGDSITQGFQSLAIHKTDWSWAAMVAAAFDAEFTFPVFVGPEKTPGLPVNLEAFMGRIDRAIGERPLQLHFFRALGSGLASAAGVGKYWDRGDGSHPPPPQSNYFDNLAIWGWDIRDCLSKDRNWCQAKLKPVSAFARLNPKRRFSASHPNERTAVRTLWSATAPDDNPTQLTAAESLGAENGGRGIETLVVALGSNNALKSVISLQLIWSEDAGYRDLVEKEKYTVWTPDHFRAELDELVPRIRDIGAAHTIWVTVPHVTVTPLLRGVGEKPYNSRYFSRYTRPWISDQKFDPLFHKYLTGEDARLIDAAIDQYNWAIKQRVHAERLKGNDWLVVDLCGLLDRLAYRRYLSSTESRPAWWNSPKFTRGKRGNENTALPPEYQALTPQPDTRYFFSDTVGRTSGGLVALDGVHPTTIGYGLIADQVLQVMVGAGVKRLRPDGRPASAPPAIDFAEVIRNDTLINSPPRHLNEIAGTLAWGNRTLNYWQAVFGKKPS